MALMSPAIAPDKPSPRWILEATPPPTASTPPPSAPTSTAQTPIPLPVPAPDPSRAAASQAVVDALGRAGDAIQDHFDATDDFNNELDRAVRALDWGNEPTAASALRWAADYLETAARESSTAASEWKPSSIFFALTHFRITNGRFISNMLRVTCAERPITCVMPHSTIGRHLEPEEFPRRSMTSTTQTGRWTPTKATYPLPCRI